MSEAEISPTGGAGGHSLRYRINLRKLPLWSRYAIAVAVAGIVMYFAWHVGHTRPTPAWLREALPFWLIAGPLLLVFFLARWVFQLLKGK
jgi:hypothetical protein